jgi:hypothetical protein
MVANFILYLWTNKFNPTVHTFLAHKFESSCSNGLARFDLSDYTGNIRVLESAGGLYR